MKSVWLCAAVVALSAAAPWAPADEAKKSKGGYVHVVIFKLKADAPKSAVDAVIADCHKMLAKIKAVRAVKAGKPDKSGKLSKKDYDVGLLVLVDDAAGLKSYLEDPLHVQFVKKHGKHFDMEKLRIFDFVDAKK
jgi:hypothetical protein